MSGGSSACLQFVPPEKYIYYDWGREGMQDMTGQTCWPWPLKEPQNEAALNTMMHSSQSVPQNRPSTKAGQEAMCGETKSYGNREGMCSCRANRQKSEGMCGTSACTRNYTNDGEDRGVGREGMCGTTACTRNYTNNGEDRGASREGMCSRTAARMKQQSAKSNFVAQNLTGSYLRGLKVDRGENRATYAIAPYGESMTGGVIDRRSVNTGQQWYRKQMTAQRYSQVLE